MAWEEGGWGGGLVGNKHTLHGNSDKQINEWDSSCGLLVDKEIFQMLSLCLWTQSSIFLTRSHRWLLCDMSKPVRV